MTRLSLDSRDTALLADIVDGCSSAEGTPLPWHVLDQVKLLLHADELTFGGFDSVLPHVWFMQGVDAEDGHGVDTETPVEARDNPFWVRYWDTPCSYPDRSGDFVSVTRASDLAPLRGRARDGGPHWSMRACLPGRIAGRHYRMVAWRRGGRDFTERERFLLALVRPHVSEAYRASVQVNAEPTSLTTRQLQVMRMVEAGLTNRQVARRMEMSEATVRTHLNNIYARLGVSGRVAAVHAVFGSSEAWPRTG
jgi:DNA-binding CsgD family transcriptional regulator